MRRLIVLGPALVMLALGCGGGAASSSSSGSTAPVSANAGSPRARSVRQILGPMSVHQSAAELAEVAALIRRWEQDPYGVLPENDTELSNVAVMLMWLVESPDVSVSVCQAVQALAEGQGGDVGPAVTTGSMFGMAAYLIEHPGASPTSAEVQVGGIESALRWYTASLRNGQTPNALLDELVAQYAEGGTAALMTWYAEHDVRCGEG